MSHSDLSVVVPTLSRPDAVAGLLANLSLQTSTPLEILIVDGASDDDRRTEAVVGSVEAGAAAEVHYLRSGRGTARQRNLGIDRARGLFVALIDDDIRLDDAFFERCIEVLSTRPEVGAVCGLITDQLLDPDTSPHWRWMRRLRCFHRFEPGRFDAASGHPIPRYLGGLHEEERPIEVMGAGCAVWRREAFDGGLRFDPWFTGYGMLEDVHLSLRAARDWTLLELGTARCTHLRAREGRPDPEELALRSVVSYRYLFETIVPAPSRRQRVRWWYVQAVDLLRLVQAALRGGDDARAQLRGKLRGVAQVLRRAGRREGLSGAGDPSGEVRRGC